MHIDLLIHASWVIPVEPEGTVLRDHAVAVNGRRIVAVLPSTEARQRYRPRAEEHLSGHALLPGFINAHTHAAMTLYRGLADDRPLMEWLEQHIWPAEQRWVDPGFVRDGTRHAIAEMLRSGTTCFSDMYFFPGEVAETAAECGMRVVVGLIVLEFPTRWARDAHEYFSNGLRVHDALRGHALVRTAFAPHAPYTVSDPSLERVRVLAEELDLPIHMHVHETVHEVEGALAANGERPLARLQRLGLLSPRFIAVHMTQLQDAEVAMLAGHGASVAHCPHSNLKLASGFCPVHRLSVAGVNVALGTDSAASNNSLDMLAELRSAALLAKAVAGDAAALPAARALSMATVHGARALGIDALTGSLLPGKEADLIAVRLDAIETEPLYDPISQLVYATGREAIAEVWVAGRQVLRDRELLTVDRQAVLRASRAWQVRIGAADAHGG